MDLDTLLKRFKKQSPVAFGTRLILTRMLSIDRLDQLFSDHAVRQKSGELLFSSVANIMSLVALNIKPSVNAAYKHLKDQVGVSVASIYNKLQGIEPQVGRALVRETAAELSLLFDSLKGPKPTPVFKGYQTRIVDGNHLAGTEHRIKELRSLGAAALPGTALVILDPDRKLLVDVLPCRNGHANEATLHPEMLEEVQPSEVWIGDRHFASQNVMSSIALDKKAYFVMRHSNALLPKWEEVGSRVAKGKVEGGRLFEQKIKFTYKGRTLTLRRITIELDKPTRKGDSAIQILTNLPSRVSAKQINKGYRKRWTIEVAFLHLATTLQSEVKTLGYPEAALFSFCVSLMMHNIISVIKTSIGCALDNADLGEEVSTYYAANDISESWKGFSVAVSQAEFESAYSDLTIKKLAGELTRTAKGLDLSQFRKSKRGPKAPPPKKKSGNRGNHVATAKILDLRAAN